MHSFGLDSLFCVHTVAGLRFGENRKNKLNKTLVIVDEAHNLCVNSQTDPKQVAGLKRLCSALRQVSAETSVTFLTATPVVMNEKGETDHQFLLLRPSSKSV